jgi:hypothetical protein
MIVTLARSTMRSTGMKAASALLTTVVSAWFVIGSAAAADMPSYPPAPPQTGYYNPPVEEGYAVPPPPAVYGYPAPVYRYAPPVAVVPGPYYARPYYGWGYGPRRYARGYYAGRYHGYYR